MKIIWSPLAIDRTTEIAEYIAQDNQTAASNWVENLFDKVQLLKSSPRSGRIVPETHREDIRELIYGNYRIIYRVEKTKLSILTVRHGKQILPIEDIQA
ncbi:MAG: type II toxin-antitoxin system RelE/ParE family toxin [Desulfobulbaceae bacterium]|uniref:Type II toxin-antitoxin system RelE/ParE family toxin n=1 Tax=Candidatus Desulfobia pelagia TaxID=2841692 RepID=A0A8J6TGM5_9BACT|nr:type II toxin-antitoxin system RelE/ParE family toxin [Candidatus Desulfobia pelagia]